LNSRDRVPLVVILMLVFIAAIAASVAPFVLAAAGPPAPGAHSTEHGTAFQARTLRPVGGGGPFVPADTGRWVAEW
jgi:hypothetical protein